MSLFSRALAMRSSKAALKSEKDLRPASLMTGTMRVRPFFVVTSTAMPRCTASSSMTCGLPSTSRKCLAIPGISCWTARAIA